MARDASKGAAPSTAVVTSRTAELILAANAVASAPGIRLSRDDGWAADQLSRLDNEARAFLPRLAGFWWPTLSLIDFLCALPLFDDPEAFLNAVERIPMAPFLVKLYNGDLAEAEVRELMAHPERAGELGDRLSQFSSGTAEAHVALFRDPEGHRRGLLHLVAASNTPLFRQSFDALTREADQTVRVLRARLAAEDPMAVVESLRTKPVDRPTAFTRYTFVPSRLLGHRHVQSWDSGHLVFFLQEGATDVSGPTAEGAELADFLRVLGDKTRMDILRLLCCRPSYGKEIAAKLGLTTATVSRQLDQLKAAGLVREDKADANNVKLLRYAPEALEGRLDRLKIYLMSC